MHRILTSSSGNGLQIQSAHAGGYVLSNNGDITSHERAHATSSISNQLLHTWNGSTMVLNCGAIKNAVMLIIYFAGKGLKVGRGATLARAALPDQILPPPHLHPQCMCAQPEAG